MNNILINYGIRAGGVSYIWDDWSAYSSVSSGTTVTVGDPVEGAQEIQVQTRTRTGYTYSQLQTRTRTCSCTSQSGIHRNDVYGLFVNETYMAYRRRYYNCSGVEIYSDISSFCNEYNSCPSGNYLICSYEQFSTNECQVQYSSGYYYNPSCSPDNLFYNCNTSYTTLIEIQCANTTTTSCNWSGYTGWSNTSSCSTSSPGCSNGAVQRQCRTVTLCAWNAYSEWSDVSSCTESTPACSNGALERRCQQRTRNAIEG